MNNSNDCIFQLIDQFKAESLILYILVAIIFAFIIRVILCLFKAFALKNGEHDDIEKNINWANEKYWYLFKRSFLGFKRHITIDDYWLPAIVGFAELFVYPFLMSIGKWLFIGTWIGVKTASSWGGWQLHRTAYNRFLLGNILSLLFSIFLAWLFLK